MGIAKEFVIEKTRIDYKGIFDLNGLLVEMRKWIGVRKFEFHERKFIIKSGDEGTEYEIEWECNRKINTYVKFYITVVIKGRGAHPVEVIKNGNKLEQVQGMFNFTLGGRAELDWENRFGKKWYLKYLMDFYNNYIIKKDILYVWGDELTYRVYKLHRLIKDHLDMESKTNPSEGRF